jgi:hypothetical protein
MPQQDSNFKKKTSLAIFKQKSSIPTENHPAMGMLGAGSIRTVSIPLGQLKEAVFQARKLGPDVTKATKQTMRVLYNEGNVGSLTSMLKGKADSTVKAIMDDMQFPSSKTAAGYVKDGYPLASMAKLPKGTVTNRAGSGAGLARIQRDLASLGTPKPRTRPAPAKKNAGSMPSGSSSVGYRPTPTPGSAASIPRGGTVGTGNPPGRQLRNRK